MPATDKDVQPGAQAAGLPEGPNVGPSPQEHLAAQGSVKPARHAGDAENRESPRDSVPPAGAGAGAAGGG